MITGRLAQANLNIDRSWSLLFSVHEDGQGGAAVDVCGETCHPDEPSIEGHGLEIQRPVSQGATHMSPAEKVQQVGELAWVEPLTRALDGMGGALGRASRP